MTATNAEVEANGDNAAARAIAASKGGDERLAFRGVFQRLLIQPEIGALIGAVAIWAFFWAVSANFGTASGTQGILDLSATLGVMAVAVSMLMIGGEFDLSSGANTGAMAMLTIFLVKPTGDLGGLGLPVVLALLVSLLIALGIGWLNGFMVDRTALPSFIVTLATFFVLKGLKLGLSKVLVQKIEMGKMDDAQGATWNLFGLEIPSGYDTFKPIFSGEWARLDHIWAQRDLAYSLLALIGIGLVVVTFYEMNFKHRDESGRAFPPVHRAGTYVALAGVAVIIIGWILGLFGADISIGGRSLALLGFFVAAAGALFASIATVFESLRTFNFVPGAIVVTVGVLILHWTDSIVGNWIAAIVIAIGAAVGLIGLGLGRYERGDSFGSVQLNGGITKALGIGVGAVIAGFIALIAISSTNSQNVYLDVPLVGWRIRFFPFTVQGVRAALAGVLLGGGYLYMFIAASRAKRVNPMTKAVVSMITAGFTVAFAFVIQLESKSYKFRAEAFTVVLTIALLIAVWAIVGLLFEQRRTDQHDVDQRSIRVGVVGLLWFAAAMVIKLMFTVQAELDAGINPSKYSVRIVWFVAFAALMAWVLSSTRFGSWTFAVGGNAKAARETGVPAARTKTRLFMLVSGAAWLTGVLLAFRINSVQANTGDGSEFEYIIAAVIGGTLLTGGYGTAVGGAIGALVMAMATLGIPQSNWNSDWRFLFLGVILLLSAISNKFIRTKAEAS